MEKRRKQTGGNYGSDGEEREQNGYEYGRVPQRRRAGVFAHTLGPALLTMFPLFDVVACGSFGTSKIALNMAPSHAC